jgi:RecA/RadA recombinase
VTKLNSTGSAVLDERLHGGVPRGQISEIAGPRSSGRAGLLVAMLAGVTARGEMAALVGCEQEPDWHPEGDVWTHTLLVSTRRGRLKFI